MLWFSWFSLKYVPLEKYNCLSNIWFVRAIMSMSNVQLFYFFTVYDVFYVHITRICKFYIKTLVFDVQWIIV